MPRGSFRAACRSAWSGSTCPSRCRWLSTALAGGSAACLATPPSMAARGCGSTPASRRSPRAGRPEFAPARNTRCRRCVNLLGLGSPRLFLARCDILARTRYGFAAQQMRVEFVIPPCWCGSDTTDDPPRVAPFFGPCPADAFFVSRRGLGGYRRKNIYPAASPSPASEDACPAFCPPKRPQQRTRPHRRRRDHGRRHRARRRGHARTRRFDAPSLVRGAVRRASERHADDRIVAGRGGAGRRRARLWARCLRAPALEAARHRRRDRGERAAWRTHVAERQFAADRADRAVGGGRRLRRARSGVYAARLGHGVADWAALAPAPQRFADDRRLRRLGRDRRRVQRPDGGSVLRLRADHRQLYAGDHGAGDHRRRVRDDRNPPDFRRVADLYPQQPCRSRGRALRHPGGHRVCRGAARDRGDDRGHLRRAMVAADRDPDLGPARDRRPHPRALGAVFPADPRQRPRRHPQHARHRFGRVRAAGSSAG